jgi:hypothetical protein
MKDEFIKGFTLGIITILLSILISRYIYSIGYENANNEYREKLLKIGIGYWQTDLDTGKTTFHIKNVD